MGAHHVRIEDHPIPRLLFAATRRTETANPTTTAVVATSRTAARQARTTRLPPEADLAQLEVRVHA
jgi:hypothetical protein